MKKKIANDIAQLAKKVLIKEENFNTEEIKKDITVLYEKITILSYLESQGETPIIEQGTSLDSKAFREQNWFKDPKPVPAPSHDEDLVEPLIEKIKDIVAQMPAESQRVDELLEEVLPRRKFIKNDLEDFAAQYQEMPTFKRKEEAADTPKETPKEEENNSTNTPQPTAETTPTQEQKPKSLNDVANKNLKVGLNDRLAFTKHLFNNNADDFQRVLSQINTFETADEARQFIDNHIKPDYPQWEEKEDIVTRFMTLVEKRFH